MNPLVKMDKTSLKVEDWLKKYVAELIDVKAESIDTEKSFDQHGLDSLDVTELVSNLEEYLGEELSINLLDKYKSIKSLAIYLENRSENIS